MSTCDIGDAQTSLQGLHALHQRRNAHGIAFICWWTRLSDYSHQQCRIPSLLVQAQQSPRGDSALRGSALRVRIPSHSSVRISAFYSDWEPAMSAVALAEDVL